MMCTKFRRVVLALSAAVLAAASLCAQASGGRISFSGAVVTPTCDPGHVALEASRQSRRSCGGAGEAPFRVHVQPAADLPGQPLLAYLEGYLRQAGQTGPVMVVTQSYD